MSIIIWKEDDGSLLSGKGILVALISRIDIIDRRLLSRVNEALTHLESGKARYRIVLRKFFQLVRELFFIPQTPDCYIQRNVPVVADILPYKELENTIIYKCKECGLTDSRLKDIS